MVTEVDGHQPSTSTAAAVVQEEEGANPPSSPPLDSGKAGTGGTNPSISPPVSASPAMRAYFELSEMAISNIGVEAPAELKTEILTRNDTEIYEKKNEKRIRLTTLYSLARISLWTRRVLPIVPATSCWVPLWADATTV